MEWGCRWLSRRKWAEREEKNRALLLSHARSFRLAIYNASWCLCQVRDEVFNRKNLFVARTVLTRHCSLFLHSVTYKVFVILYVKLAASDGHYTVHHNPIFGFFLRSKDKSRKNSNLYASPRSVDPCSSSLDFQKPKRPFLPVGQRRAQRATILPLTNHFVPLYFRNGSRRIISRIYFVTSVINIYADPHNLGFDSTSKFRWG